MGLDSVRKELNNYDNMIKNMINLRMSLIPIVADIKIKNNLPLFQEKREDEIYNNIEIFAKENGADCDLVKNIYKLIIENALKIEVNIAEYGSNPVINSADIENIENVKQEFQKLDYIMQNEIPEILSKIKKKCERQNLNQIATLYYNNKINSKGEC